MRKRLLLELVAQLVAQLVVKSGSTKEKKIVVRMEVREVHQMKTKKKVSS